MNLHITPSFKIDRLCKTASVLLFLVTTKVVVLFSTDYNTIEPVKNQGQTQCAFMLYRVVVNCILVLCQLTNRSGLFNSDCDGEIHYTLLSFHFSHLTKAQFEINTCILNCTKYNSCFMFNK